MTTDVVSVASLVMMCVLGYCVIKICLALINAIERTVQAPELGAGEQIVVQRAVDTRRGLRRNSIERRVSNPQLRRNCFTVLFTILLDYKTINMAKWLAGRNY